METSGADLLALANNIKDNDSHPFGGNSCILWILIIFFLFGGFGWGNNGNALTRSDLFEGLNSQNTFSEFRSVQNEITNGFAGVNQNLCNINGATQLGFANTNQNMCAGFNGIQAAIADTNYRMQDCCCNIKSLIREDGEATRNLMQQNEIQRLRDELQDAKTEQLVTGLVAAQGVQTQNLMDFFRKALNGGCCSC